MKSTIITLLVMFFWQAAFSQVLKPANKPNEAQKQLINRGYGMFITYGINTFNEHEWSDGTTPASEYNPTKLDCDQWIRVARDAGFRYVLLVTKHHDGFCLWDSKYTEYDVASSPVKTDVVKWVSDACKKYGLEFSVYYSLWDRNAPSYKEGNLKNYVNYMINQLTELFTNYGDVCELWFDGGWDKPIADWELERVYNHVKKLQPNCAIGTNHTIEVAPGTRKHVHPDLMTVDNKYNFQYFPSDFRLWDPKIAHKADKKQYIHNGQSYYLPFEHTVCLSKRWNWYQKSDPRPVRSLDELEELFYWCTDNDNTLLMNVPPDKTGRIMEHEASAIIALNTERLHLERGKPLPRNGECISFQANVEASSVKDGNTDKYSPQNAVDGGQETAWIAADTLASLVIELDSQKSFNKISIFEKTDATVANDYFSTYRTNHIEQYSIEIFKDGDWELIYIGDELMGDCKVINFPYSYSTSKLQFKVLKANSIPGIYEINIINR